MPSNSRSPLIGIVAAVLVSASVAASEVPLRIESVVPSPVQPCVKNAATIWSDDFDDAPKNYGEASGPLTDAEHFGPAGKSLLQFYAQGEQGTGNRKVFFGDSPMRNSARRGEKFSDVYWRLYVKHESGWTGGGPDKLSRATILVSPNWSQAMISHVWSSGDVLTLDPATGIQSDAVKTTRYNDFPNLRWLGNKPTATTPMFSQAESGWWVCVESRAKLNTPGKKDGIAQLWIDGRLEAERTSLDWRGAWDEKGINAVFIEAYWNKGSPVAQSRFVDHLVIATEPIGPVVVPCHPTFIRTSLATPEETWEVELATERGETVWQSQKLSGDANTATVDSSTGTFVGGLLGKAALPPDSRFYFRIRSVSSPEWSRYHQRIRTEP